MSHLFREFHLTLKFGGSLALDPEELKIYLQAKQDFLEMIPTGLEGADYVQGVYDTMDRIVSENTAQFPIVCGSGCSHCCYQMVCCTNTEMKLITAFLQGKSTEKRKIKSKAKKRSMEYYAVIPASALVGLTTRFEGINDPLGEAFMEDLAPSFGTKNAGSTP